MIAGGYDDAETAFTSVAARRFASPPFRQVRALSSRFSGSGCPEAEGTRLSGERVITRADSFHSASTSTSRRTRPLISFGIWKSGVRSQKSEWRRRRLISSQREQNSRCDPYNGNYAFSRTTPRKSGPCGAVQHKENKWLPATSQIFCRCIVGKRLKLQLHRKLNKSRQVALIHRAG